MRESQAVVALSTRGPAGFAAVSIETDGGGIGVGESIVGASTVGGPVLLSSPCSLAAGPQGYVPTGSTYGGSDVRLSLYDPDATPAVVNVNVSTGTTQTSPPAFQGVVVPATGLVVLDLHRWVFEQSSLAVTATAVSGDVVVGALELTSETVEVASRSAAGHGTSHVRVTGSSLLVGPDRGRRQWAFASMQSRKGVASTFSVYNPGTRPVSVSVAPPGRAGIVAALTEVVPGGGIVDFATPVTGKSGLGTGSVVISAQGPTPVVVARLTTRYKTRVLEDIDATPGTAGPSDEWLLPGASLTSRIDDDVTLEDPGTEGATVTLLELAHGAAASARLEVVSLGAGSEVELNLRSVLKYCPLIRPSGLGERPDPGGAAADAPQRADDVRRRDSRPALSSSPGSAHRQGVANAVVGCGVGVPDCRACAGTHRFGLTTASARSDLGPVRPVAGRTTRSPGLQAEAGQTAVGGIPVEDRPGAAGVMTVPEREGA